MDNIINFPTQTVRDKALIEKTIKGLLSQIPLDQDSINNLTGRLISLWEQYQHEFCLKISFPFPSSLTPKVQNRIEFFYNPFKEKR